jgi:hypothetical protein
LRLRSKNSWITKSYESALKDTIKALQLLGIEVDSAPTKRDAERMFEQVKNEVLAVGFDEILSIPRTTDSRSELAIMLLNDAGKVDLAFFFLVKYLKFCVRYQCVLESLTLRVFGCDWSHCAYIGCSFQRGILTRL